MWPSIRQAQPASAQRSLENRTKTGPSTKGVEKIIPYAVGGPGCPSASALASPRSSRPVAVCGRAVSAIALGLNWIGIRRHLIHGAGRGHFRRLASGPGPGWTAACGAKPGLIGGLPWLAEPRLRSAARSCGQAKSAWVAAGQACSPNEVEAATTRWTVTAAMTSHRPRPRRAAAPRRAPCSIDTFPPRCTPQTSRILTKPRKSKRFPFDLLCFVRTQRRSRKRAPGWQRDSAAKGQRHAPYWAVSGSPARPALNSLHTHITSRGLVRLVRLVRGSMAAARPSGSRRPDQARPANFVIPCRFP